MMERYSGDFLAAVDGLRALLGCRGRVWPVSVEPASLCAEYADGTRDARRGRGRRRPVARPRRCAALARAAGGDPSRVADAIRAFDAVIIGPGSFFTSLMPPLLVRGVKEALADVRGPIILITNLLTEGRGMDGFTAADARALGRARHRPPVDVVIANTGRPSTEARRATPPSTRSRSSSASSIRASRRCSGRSGRPTSRATIAAGWRLRCGRCSVSGC